MSEILRKPEKLRLQGICKIPTGKAGKAAAKQYANERKARKRALSQLAVADYMDGVGLLVMLNSADRELGRYIFKKLDKIIPFYVKAISDGTSGMPAEEMSWLMDACERRGYRTLWLDLAGIEKIDKKAVLHLVAGELMRLLEGPAPERAQAQAETETTMVEESIEPETAEAMELSEPEVEVDEPAGPEAAVGESSETEATEEEETAEPQEESELESKGAEDVIAELKSEDVKQVAESPVTVEEIPEIEENPMAEEKPAEEIISVVEEKPVSEEKPAAKEEPEPDEKQAPEEKPVPRRRSRKAPAKTEGEKAPAKPRRKRAPAAPLTVEATLAKRRKQMGLE